LEFLENIEMFFRIPDWLRYEIQYRWERLAVREWINKHPKIIFGITSSSVFLLLVIVIWLLIPEKTIEIEVYENGWFYDLNTDKLFVAKIDLVPPIEAPSGALANGEPAGVRAYVFSYVEEPNESERYIGFLEIPDPNAKMDVSISGEIRTGGVKQWGQGKLIRRVTDEKWTPAGSVEGQAILREAFRANEKGKHPYYYPAE
jgi:hypothetical protein